MARPANENVPGKTQSADPPKAAQPHPVPTTDPAAAPIIAETSTHHSEPTRWPFAGRSKREENRPGPPTPHPRGYDSAPFFPPPPQTRDIGGTRHGVKPSRSSFPFARANWPPFAESDPIQQHWATDAQHAEPT